MATTDDKIELENRRAEVKHELDSLRAWQKSRWLVIIPSFIIVLICAFFYFIFRGDYSDWLHDRRLLFTFLLTILAATIFLSGLFAISQHVSQRNREKELLSQVATLGSEKIQDNLEENFFTNLVKINFKYIDKYYLQTQIQADKSFLIAVVSAIIAFVIIISGIVLMYFNKINSAYIATGAGVLSQFISAVFFYLYNKTIVKMGEYHEKLVLTQNISLALKITEQMPDIDKTKAQTLLIEQLTKDINLHLASRPEN